MEESKKEWEKIIEETKKSCFLLSDNLSSLMDLQKSRTNVAINENEYKEKLDSLMEIYNRLELVKKIANTPATEDTITTTLDGEEVTLWKHNTGEWFIPEEDGLLFCPETDLLRGIRVRYNDTWHVHLYN